MKIDLRAITFPGEIELISEISTQPSTHGANPNIGAVLSFKCKIPKDPLFCPSLSCNVYDYLLSGISQPLIGTFSIDLTYAFNKNLLTNAVRSSVKLPSNMIDPNITENEKKAYEEVSLLDPNIKNQLDVPHGGDSLNDPGIQAAMRVSYSIMPISLSEAQEKGKIVLMPVFKSQQGKKKEIEVKVRNNHYIPLGFNRKHNDGLKHYRYLLDTSFEKSELFGAKPFDCYQIKRGQSRGLSKGLQIFSKKTGGDQSASTITDAGIFKGLVRLTYKKKNISAEDQKEENDGFNRIAKLLVTKSDCLIVIYILNAFDLVQKDIGSASDPYLRLKLGSKIESDRENYIENNPNPKFFKCFQMNTTFPGESTLKIQVWDYDSFLSDEKIGTTKIDLEDRFFSETWNSLPDKPIETRKLSIKSSKHPQGYIRLWIEIHQLYSTPKIWDITPKPPEKFELRLIIWRSEDVPFGDIEGVSDLYIVASINSGEKKETDTHYRSQNGNASWNWRMKFPLEVDEQYKCLLYLQLWDRDIVSFDDAIGDATLDLTDIALQALETGDTIKKTGTSENIGDRLKRQENEKFWVDFSSITNDGKTIKAGKLLISVEILPNIKALACANGEGRSEPNIEPILPEPEGRIKLTLNPLTMLKQMIGEELRRKICCGLICAICLFLFVMTIPTFFSSSVSVLIFGN